MRLSFLTIFVVACGGTVTNVGTDSGTDGGTDGASDAASTIDSPTGFCTGSAPRLMINGSDVPIIKASGKAIILNCCDSAELTLATSAYQALLNVMWRAPAGGNANIDLANPPQGFGIEMDLGCDPSTTSCATASPEERYADGFTGTLQYTAGSGGLDVSYCLQVAEAPSQPHTVIHSMALYAPNVVSP